MSPKLQSHGRGKEQDPAPDPVIAAVAADEDSWGQIANDVSDDGKYQDQEQNENIDGNEEPEIEANVHGDGANTKDAKDTKR